MVRNIPLLNTKIKLYCYLSNGESIKIIAKVKKIRHVAEKYIMDTITDELRRISFTFSKRNRAIKTLKGPKVLFYEIIN